MRKTLYLKFMLGYLLFALFGFIIVASFVSNMTLDHCRNSTADRLYKEAATVADTYASDLYDSRISLDSVQSQLKMLSAFLHADILIVNPSGRVVVTSSELPDPSIETYISGFDPSVTGSEEYAVDRFFDTYDDLQLYVLAPITGGYKVRGYVCIVSPYTDVTEESESLLSISYLELIVLFLLSGILLIFFTELVYIPLRRITAATEQYAAGNMEYRFSVDSEDEIGYLAASLNYMAGSISHSENDQKKFIANISHDFRSPLTSIKGFLEAMLDGTIPAELHEKYIATVLNETERLIKLTNDLLSLNTISAGGILLRRADFDLNHTIRSVAASFEQTCRSRKVAIELVLTSDSFFVNADEERIKQVLYNLVDNAIKFSPTNSVIVIETTEKSRKILCSVKDKGCGIPKEDQSRVFDRFYKSDVSRGKDKTGTGLGLSIVREILRAHGENINLVSTVGVGSEFIFSLPISSHQDEE